MTSAVTHPSQVSDPQRPSTLEQFFQPVTIIIMFRFFALPIFITSAACASICGGLGAGTIGVGVTQLCGYSP
jgi:hypothetical protein